MKTENTKSADATIAMRNGELAQTRIVILLVACFLLRLGASAYWYHRATKSSGAPGTDPAASGQPLITLSEPMKSDWQRLDSPVEIRFHVPASRGTLPEVLQAFAGRVDELLAGNECEARAFPSIM